MPRPRFDKLPEERRQEILQSAAQEFAEHGYSGASMNQIIERAGLSKGAMYYYFDDKQDLYTTVMVRTMQQVVELIGDLPQVVTAEAFWVEMERLLTHTLSFTMRNPTLLGLMRSLAEGISRGELGEELEAWHHKLHQDWNVRFVKLGQDVGAVRTDLPTDLLIALLEGLNQSGDAWFSLHFEELGTEGLDRLMSKLIGIYRKMLEPDSKSPEVIE